MDRRQPNPFPYTLADLLEQKRNALILGVDTTEIELEIEAVLDHEHPRKDR